MIVTDLAEGFLRELVGLALDLLQAENVRTFLFQESLHVRCPQADRVDVPGGEFERLRWHAARLSRAARTGQRGDWLTFV